MNYTYEEFLNGSQKNTLFHCDRSYTQQRGTSCFRGRCGSKTFIADFIFEERIINYQQRSNKIRLLIIIFRYWDFFIHIDEFVDVAFSIIRLECMDNNAFKRPARISYTLHCLRSVARAGIFKGRNCSEYTS